MESIVSLNQRLIDHYGIDTASRRPIFRIVWADEQVEKRMMDTLDSGIQLLYPVVREVKKYAYLRHVHVLERLVVVPDFQQKELADEKTSYEPVWTFMDADGNSLPPKWEPIKLIVDTLYAALGKSSMAKYVENNSPEEQDKRVAQIQEELFGDQSGLYGKTLPGSHEGVVVPHNYGE